MGCIQRFSCLIQKGSCYIILLYEHWDKVLFCPHGPAEIEKVCSARFGCCRMDSLQRHREASYEMAGTSV